MADLEIPAGIGALTPEWLTQALRRTGAIAKAAVASFDSRRFAEGAGYMGELARIALRYDRPEDGAPRSLIAKLPTTSPVNRQIAGYLRLYEIETRFYQEIAGQVELRTPRCYYSALDTASGDFVLLLEDLAPARTGDHLAGCSPAQAELALRELAKFHAAWWDDPRLGGLTWLPSRDDPARAQMLEAVYQRAWGPFVERYGSQVPPAILKIGERYGQTMRERSARSAERPRTFVHGDYRPENLFFAGPEGGVPFAAIDWQVCAQGQGMQDVAYFLSGGMAPQQRKAHEMELLRTYQRVLAENGVRGYDFDQCLYDYRALTLGCLGYDVAVLGTLDLAGQRGEELFTTVLQRRIAAIIDLDAGELLSG